MFRQYVLDRIDVGADDLENVSGRESGDKILSPNEISRVLKINVGKYQYYESGTSSYKGIKSLVGVKYFTRLQDLDCSGQELTGVNVSGLTSLTYLTCDGNSNMTYLNVEGCTNLGSIWCYDCALEGELDLSEIGVSQLRCYNNPELTVKLPVIASDRLGIAYLYAEGIKAVGPLNATTLGASLRTFNCPNLTRTDDWTLDLSGEFTIYVTRIDVSGNPTLKEIKWNSTSQGQTFAALDSLNISGTQIDVQPLINTLTERSGNPEEFFANAMVNGITTLDVSKFTNLRTLELSGDAMTSITLPSTMAEYSDASVTLANNKFTTLPAIPTNAKYVILAGNELTTLPTIPATVTRLDVSDNNFETLDVSGLTALQYLYTNDNNLTTLDVTQNTDLTYLRVENNENMATLSLAGLEKLSHLDISGTKVPLSVAPTTLFELHADKMAYALTTADFSSYQQLHTLHISNNPSLTTLTLQSSDKDYLVSSMIYATDNALTSVTMSNAYNIYFDNNKLATLDLSGCDEEYPIYGTVSLTGQTLGTTFALAGSDGAWTLNFADVVGSGNVANVQDVTGYASDNTSITPTVSGGVYTFATAPTRVAYKYNTGGKKVKKTDPTDSESDPQITYEDVLMDVSFTVSNGSEPVVVAPTLSVSSQTLYLTAGVEMTAFTIRATAGSDLRWSTSGNLPSGVTGVAASDNLSFTISGTPAASTAGQTFSYEVTATNTAGEAKATITLSVAKVVTVDEINNMTSEQKAAETNLQITGNVEDSATLLEGFTNLEMADLSQANFTTGTVTLPETNNLESLNLSGNATVKNVDVGSTGGKLTTINLINCTELEEADVSNTQATTLNVTGCEKLTTLKAEAADGNGKIREITGLEDCAATLEELDISGNSLLWLDLTNFGKLTSNATDLSGQKRSGWVVSTIINWATFFTGGSFTTSDVNTAAPDANNVTITSASKNGSNVGFTTENGQTTFDSEPDTFTYEYNAKDGLNKMDVTISGSGGDDNDNNLRNSGGGCNNGLGAGVFSVLALMFSTFKKK
ncbi:MAG: hypothetical protein IJS40_00780 [Synergistaceae bacterium]|nr:hypothetical protein [Synergistaceae bacterium]